MIWTMLWQLFLDGCIYVYVWVSHICQYHSTLGDKSNLINENWLWQNVFEWSNKFPIYTCLSINYLEFSTLIYLELNFHITLKMRCVSVIHYWILYVLCIYWCDVLLFNDRYHNCRCKKTIVRQWEDWIIECGL